MNRFVSTFPVTLVISLCAFAQTQPQVTIGHISFANPPNLSAAELDKIEGEVEGHQCGLVEAIGCIAGHVRDAFQQRGYFKAVVSQVNMKPEVNAGKVSAVLSVTPGTQYRLKDLELTGQQRFSMHDLQPLITLKAGELFNITDVRQTLENLRSYYLSRGYPNVSIVPDTMVNEKTLEISVSLDIDPEPQDQLR